MGHALIPTCNEHVENIIRILQRELHRSQILQFLSRLQILPRGEISVIVSLCIFQKETKGKVVIKDEGHLKMDFFASCEPNYF